MRVGQNESGFKEVVVTLETQDEVDQLFGLTSNARIWNNSEIARLIRGGLDSFHTGGYMGYWNHINQVLAHK